MKKQTTNQATIDRNQKIVISHYSDGSELIPSGITSDFQAKENLVVGYTRDDEGIINSVSIEPDMYLATYPIPKEKLGYISLGVVAVGFVVTLLLISVGVS